MQTCGISKEPWEINFPLCRGRKRGERASKERLAKKEMERVRWAVNAIFLTIDQPAGQELFGLEVSKPLPCLLCVCVLMCEPIDLYCTCMVALCVGQSA